MKMVKINSNDCGGFRPPKGHLDTQMFPECEPYETNRNVVKKTVERRHKKKNKHAAQISWPLVTHDAKGLLERWKNRSLNDKDFVDKMDKLSKIPGFPGVPAFPLIRSIINTSLENYRRDGDAESAARSIAGALFSWVQMEKEKSRREELVEVEAKRFNLKQYKEAQKSRMVDDQSVIEGPNLKSITPTQLQMIKYNLEKKYPKLNWTIEKVVQWIKDNFVNEARPFDKPQDLYHGE